MVWEAILREWRENPTSYTVADGTGIEKGALLKVTDPETAIIVSGAADPIAGIAAVEKVASDGSTRLSVFKRGLFDMYASGSIVINKAVSASATPNFVLQSLPNISGGQLIGICQETASDGELVLIEVNVGGTSPNSGQ